VFLAHPVGRLFKDMHYENERAYFRDLGVDERIILK
jgi:hypothetical protein